MGPHAHIELERHLLAATARLIGRPPHDQDYPSWILASLPGTPDRTLGLLNGGPSPLPWLERSVRTVTCGADGQRADFVLIACVTAHAYLAELRQRVAVPMLDLVDETLRAAVDGFGARRLGLLATTGTLRSEIYHQAAARLDAGARVLSLLDLEEGAHGGDWLQEHYSMQPVYGAIRGRKRLGGGLKSGVAEGTAAQALVQRLHQAVGLLKGAGAEAVILGCTEIPIVLPMATLEGVPLIDPLATAASAAVEIAAGRRPLPA